MEPRLICSCVEEKSKRLFSGVSTNIGVETTARDAYQLGYNWVFDAPMQWLQNSKEEHEATLKYIFPRNCELKTANEIVSAIAEK